MTSRTFIHAELHKSALNVRTNEEDAAATEGLEANIERVGLLQALVVHAAGDGAPTPWGVLGGGRRLRAIGRLIAAGKLPADWPIAARVIDATDAEITEMSLGENLLRRDLRPYEVHAAIAHAFDQGDSVAKIAANLGQTEAWVGKQLRLGTLARPIFDAYADGNLSFEQASAYAATQDTMLQQSVYDSLSHLPDYSHSAARIRAALKVGDREAARLLLFVGEALYVGAGGMCEPDLFADGRDARVRITDEALLRRLAEERFAAERDRVRTKAERPALRFAAQPPQFSGRTDEALEFAGGPPPLAHVPTDAIVATIDLDDHGQPFTRFWWASRAAKGEASKGKGGRAAAPADQSVGVTVNAGEAFAMPDSAYAQHGRAIARDDYGLTADGLQLVRSLRRSLLRRLLLDQSTKCGGWLVTNYLVWAQARALFDKALPAQTGCRAIVGEWHDGADKPPVGLYESFATDVAAEQEWLAAVGDLIAQPFMTEKDSAVSLQLFLDAPTHWQTRTAAIVAGAALLRSADTPGWRVAAHDVLARACGADPAKLRRWWQPSPRWIGLFGRMFRLATVQPFVDAATHAGFVRLKDPDLTAAAVTAIDPANHSDPAARDRAATWLPDLLGFGADRARPLADPESAAAPSTDETPTDEARVKVKTGLRAKAAALREREAAKEPVE